MAVQVDENHTIQNCEAMDPLTTAALPTVKRIDMLRDIIAIPLLIRGSAQKFHIGYKSNFTTAIGNRRLPAYYANLNFDMPSKEWVQRMHATIHAATARALFHGNIETLFAETRSPDEYPVISCFAHTLSNELNWKDCVMEFQDVAKNKPHSKDEFKPSRGMYEWGLVHGQEKQTFAETIIPGSFVAGRNVIHAKLLFDLDLDIEEHLDILSSLEKIVYNLGFDSLERYRKAFHSGSEKQQSDMWQTARNYTGQKAWERTAETSTAYFSPAHYWYGQAVSKLFTNKFVQQSLAFVDEFVKGS